MAAARPSVPGRRGLLAQAAADIEHRRTVAASIAATTALVTIGAKLAVKVAALV